ncbi:FAD-dependent monooxygenase [Amycolatopsis speibonae]|uniref:FAD-dependent monooxygenase n=1 Tax=Amycolatopsis speibonae TaxID=1450224 RepID=A0ABV7NQQ6_9PSEU
MAKIQRVAVVGAGPAGLAIAILLREAGFDVRVYERAEPGGSGGSGLTLWPNAIRALEAMGAAEEVLAASGTGDGLRMRRADGVVLQALTAKEMEDRCGGLGRAMRRADLIRVLIDRLGERHVEFGAPCVRAGEGKHGAWLRFADGREAEADLVIGADGVRSVVRSALCGEDPLNYLGYAVVRGVARLPGPRLPATMSLGRGKQAGLFAMRGDRVYWFTAFATPPDGGTDPRPHLEAFSEWHQPIPDVIDATDPGDLVFTRIHDRVPLRRWGTGRLVLAGDAAHPSAPTLGQGTCQAFEDAIALRDAFGAANDLGEVFRRYEAERVRRAGALTLRARRMGTLGQWRNPVLCAVRDRAIRWTPRWAQVRQLREMFGTA